jgi:hypothetical protein
MSAGKAVHANARFYKDKSARLFHMEPARGTAGCKRCEQAIAKGELRCVITGGPSPAYVHVACMEFSVADDNRKKCKGCPEKLREGQDRIGYEDKSPHTMFMHGKPLDKKICGFWHPTCFQKGLEHFGSTLKIEQLRGSPRVQPSSGGAVLKQAPSKKRARSQNPPPESARDAPSDKPRKRGAANNRQR